MSYHYARAASNQPVTRHQADWQITAEVRQKVLDGYAFCITGRALAESRLVSKEFNNEVLWCFGALEDDPLVVRHLLLPDDQIVSASHCSASGKSMLAIARLAARLGCIVCAMSHSHGQFAVYSSGIDLDTMIQLADDELGWTSSVWRSAAGQLQQQEPHQQHPEQGQESSSPRVWEVSFPDRPHLRATITTARQDVSPEELDVQLRCEERQRVSVFSTFNAHGQHHCPTLKRTFCPMCGNHKDQLVAAEEVEIHVVGPEELTVDEKHAIQARCEKTSVRRAWSPAQGNQQSYQQSQYRQQEPGRVPEPSTVAGDQFSEGFETQPAGSLSPYQIWRHGELVGRIDAWLMEKIAALVPEAAVALGWVNQCEIAVHKPGPHDEREA